MRIMRRQKRKKSSDIPEITLTPLIDTALTLLVIFMVTSPLINNGIKIDLPKGNVQEVKGLQEDLVVHIDKQRHIFINGTAVKRDQLVTHLKKQIGNQKNKTVFVKGDGKVEYQDVITLVEEIKTVGGIDRVALATSKMA
jgi:biopolymer transport protein TolR